VRVGDCLPDKVSDGLVGEVTLEVIPGRDQAARAFELQLHESAQCTEDVVTDGVFPTHEEPLGMTDLLERTMERTRCPSADDERGRRIPEPPSCTFFSWVVLRVVSHGVVFIDRSKHRHKTELTQMNDLSALGQGQRLKGDVLMGPFADDAVLLQANQKAQFLFPEELQVFHPGVPTARRSPRRAATPS
jgi:hypothetical protein